ncbi:MAG: D-alanyl-D-alanine carboxypeptidase/D-alanyl-D-alanine-endopeptidase, partial [Planctomycetota bacterium]
VNFNDNCVDFTFRPGSTAGGRAHVTTVPPAGGFTVKGTVKTTRDVKKHNPILDKRPTPGDNGFSVFTVGGLTARPAGPYSKPIDDPRLFFGETLKAALVERGIEVAGGVRVQTQPRDGSVVATHATPLTAVLGRVNADSQNMMAEALAKLNGLSHQLSQGVSPARARGSWASGHEAAVAFGQRIGLDTLSLTAADGSGLSRENRVSVECLAGLLTYMLREHEHGEYLLDSLAVSGVRGSLRKRMKSLAGRVYGKTGTIRGVSALSGYVFAENGRIAVFSILHNDIKGGASPYRGEQDAAIRAIADWLEALPAVRPDSLDVPVEIGDAMRHVGLVGTAE